MNSVELEILWSNLTAIVSDQAKSLQRNAFSPIVREAGDLGAALFDARGRMIAQAVTGTPGHINALAKTAEEVVNRFPVDTIDAGDVFIVNDPWKAAGHFFDITIFCPIFYKGKLIAFSGNTAHHTDVGGYGLGAGARDVHEEGLFIPLMKIYSAGEKNETLFDIIRHNVRMPRAVFGDLASQISSGRTCANHLISLCERHNLENLAALSDEIISRSEQAMRAAICKLKSGTYSGETRFDIPGGEEVVLKATVRLDAENGTIAVDFAGSSVASKQGINVVMNYTTAYSVFAIRSLINPELPNNHGSLTPITVSAPKESIVNAQYPAPVNARHVVGMFVPFPIINALQDVVPERALAEGAGAVWTVQIHGRDDNDNDFTSTMFNYSGGMGARSQKPGPSTTGYPTGIAAVPVEVLEAAMPIIFDRKEVRRNSGGSGARAGGDGQIVSFRMRTEKPWTLNAMASRMKNAPAGMKGGMPGKCGEFLINGNKLQLAGKLEMAPADVVTMLTPGGGGFGTS